jgi:hypothetical protein
VTFAIVADRSRTTSCWPTRPGPYYGSTDKWGAPVKVYSLIAFVTRIAHPLTVIGPLSENVAAIVPGTGAALWDWLHCPLASFRSRAWYATTTAP